MREIKFKAFVDNDIIEGRPAEIYKVSRMEWDDDSIVCAVLFSLKTQTFHTLKAEFFTLLEYIGKKDKHDKELYDGDIVSLNHSSPEFNYPYWNGLIEYMTSKYKSGFWVRSLSKSEINDYSFYPNTEKIGNKFENPELMKEIDNA